MGRLAAITKTPASAGVSPARAVCPSPKGGGHFLACVEAGLLDDRRPLGDLGPQVGAESGGRGPGPRAPPRSWPARALGGPPVPVGRPRAPWGPAAGGPRRRRDR